MITKSHIPFLDLRKANACFEEESLAAASRVVHSGRYLHGSETEAFEQELATACDAAYAIGTSNGLDAIRLIFRAYMELGKLRKGDGVIVQANTYIASVLPLTELGLRPVLVDMEPGSMNLDWSRAASVADADRGVKAILAVHLYGNPCWHPELTPELIEKGLLIVEDNAQAIGATVSTHSPLTGARNTGALGHAAAFSFYPTKNVGALGDAGAVTTSDRRLASVVRALANYGSDRRYHNIYQGWNCRLDEMQAALLRIRLRHLPELGRERRQKAMLYHTLLCNPSLTPPQWTAGSVWHQYVVRVAAGERDRFREHMAHNGIGTDIHYATPPHRQPCYGGTLSHASLPVTDLFASECVSLPIASASFADIARVAATANDF